MSSGKKRQTVLVAMALLLLVGLTIGYAILSAQLNITGSTTIKEARWDIHFDSVNVTEGSVSVNSSEPRIINAGTENERTFVESPASIGDMSVDSKNTKITYSVFLAQPGDFYEFTAVITNHGTLDAKLSEAPTMTGLTAAQDVYTNYSVKYADGTDIAEGDVLNHGESVTVRVRVEYDKVNIQTDADLPKTTDTLNLTVDFNYIQK